MWALPWGLRPEKKQKISQDVAEMRKRAKWLLQEISDEGEQLCVPSVIVAELLAGVIPTKHANLLATFDAGFFCPPFDVKACALAARLWQFERGLPGVSPGLPKAEQTDRMLLKSDILIVASAKEAGAARFYSHDQKCRRLAKEAGMLACDLPVSSGDIFLDAGLEGDQGNKLIPEDLDT
jgi:predicted nucleic acid-binding protein